MITLIILFIIAYYFIKIVRRKFSKPNFKGKTVWITGASSGLGQYLAYQFSKCNTHKLIISARNIQDLQRVKKGCAFPDRVQVIKLDMIDFELVRKTTQKLIQQLEKQNLKLDIVIQNAGVAQKPDFMNFSFENHLALSNLNIHGPYNHIQAFLQHMIKNQSGQIVGICSILSKFTNANRASYSASKHALLSILDSLRQQLYEYNIAVTSICPGYIQSNVGKNAYIQQPGKKCQIKDAYYDIGMKTDDFARQTVQAIYMREKQCHISIDIFKNPLRILSRGIIPDLGNYLNFYFSKSFIDQNLKKYYQKRG